MHKFKQVKGNINMHNINTHKYNKKNNAIKHFKRGTFWHFAFVAFIFEKMP